MAASPSLALAAVVCCLLVLDAEARRAIIAARNTVPDFHLRSSGKVRPDFLCDNVTGVRQRRIARPLMQARIFASDVSKFMIKLRTLIFWSGRSHDEDRDAVMFYSYGFESTSTYGRSELNSYL